MGGEWRETTLASISQEISYGYTASAQPEEVGPRFLRITDIQGGTVAWGLVPFCSIPEAQVEKYLLEFGDIVVARTGNSTGENYLFRGADKPVVFASYLIRFRINPSIADPQYVWYTMRSRNWWYFVQGVRSGSAQAGANAKVLGTFKLKLPPLPEQRAIARILGTLDDKIELNRRMNETLEAMAQALFKSWFVDFDPVVVNALKAGNPIPEKFAKRAAHYRDNPDALGLPEELLRLFPARFVDSELGPIPEGWEVKALDEIAKFQNGLALQKYRPMPGESRLPVVKIAQLRSGRANSGEWASANLRSECIIDDGDVVFSWSGSLFLTLWCGGRAALNQHLFKVTSEQYPKWFYFYWIDYRLPEFIHIASGKATTMGHIKRHHLSEALCVIPNKALMEKVNPMFEDLVTQRIDNELEFRTLATLRDTLLPKLISGELRVPDVEKILEDAI